MNRLQKIAGFPYPYFQYGSANSTDRDVIISIPASDMPPSQEERKQFIRQLLTQYQLNWNATLAVFKDGIMVDTIYPKSWIDSLNNAFYTTYANHEQLFEKPVEKMVKRNMTLAIYKCARTVLTFLTRTALRTSIKPIINGIHPFHLKLDILAQLEFELFENFNQSNASNPDIWKIIAFYIGQNMSLISDQIEIYTKDELLIHYPKLAVFINRETITEVDKKYLTQLKNDWLKAVHKFGEYHSNGPMLTCNGEMIDMKNEKF